MSPGSQGQRSDLEETSGNRCPKSISDRKQKNLRAILRAPELVQDLYRAGLVKQNTAAKLGPKKPTPEKASSIAKAVKGTAQIRQ